MSVSKEMPLSIQDLPNSYIGRSVPRPNARRLLEGRGTYVDDIQLPRLVHVAFLRSPYAHAAIASIDVSAAQRSPGVVRVITGAEMTKHCTPWVGVLTHLKGLKSAPQYALAVDRARWQGEPVVAVVAQTRAQAEDAVALVEVAFEELIPVVDMETALDPATPVIHPDLGDNLAFERRVEAGDVCGLRDGKGRGRGNLSFRPPYRRYARATYHPRRLQRRRWQAHRLHVQPGAAHDKTRPGGASWP
jgi:carbon-monoxide dehydrogenase large subunit